MGLCRKLDEEAEDWGARRSALMQSAWQRVKLRAPNSKNSGCTANFQSSLHCNVIAITIQSSQIIRGDGIDCFRPSNFGAVSLSPQLASPSPLFPVTHNQRNKDPSYSLTRWRRPSSLLRLSILSETHARFFRLISATTRTTPCHPNNSHSTN